MDARDGFESVGEQRQRMVDRLSNEQRRNVQQSMDDRRLQIVQTGHTARRRVNERKSILRHRLGFFRFLMMGEQMVTYFQTKDLTDILRNNTYWASYNNVYFPNFRGISHEEDMVHQKGPQLYSWQNSSRANIFRRDHVKVVDLKTMTSMMRCVSPRGRVSRLIDLVFLFAVTTTSRTTRFHVAIALPVTLPN